jgi:transcriptional regulator with XRE-family HTH domain
MTDKKATAASIPEPADLLADPPFRERFEQTAAALEAADLVRTMRRQALSASGLRGISQEELAQRVGISQPRISQIERAAGRDGIGYTLLRRIAHACGIEWGALVRDAIARLAIPVAEPARVVVAEPARGVIAEQARGVVMGGILPMPRFAPQAYLGHLVRDATGSLLGAIGSVLFDAAGATAAVRLLGSDVIVSCDRLVLDSRHKPAAPGRSWMSARSSRPSARFRRLRRPPTRRRSARRPRRPGAKARPAKARPGQTNSARGVRACTGGLGHHPDRDGNLYRAAVGMASDVAGAARGGPARQHHRHRSQIE